MFFSRDSMFIVLSALRLATAELPPLSDAFIGHINSKQTTWKAGRNFPVDTPLAHIIKLNGVTRGNKDSNLPGIKHDVDLKDSLPEEFDSRNKWPNCPSLSEIRDQGSCGSCWVFGAVGAMTDRICIFSNGTKQFHFSAEDLLSCTNDDNSCEGGDPIEAWVYWMEHGLVSGGNYNSSQGCRPYTIPPCKHQMSDDDPRPQCTDNVATPQCLQECTHGYNITYQKDLHRGKSVYSTRGELNIMAELYKNGPVEGRFIVYADFIHYKTGVYTHTDGNEIAKHAVKILGWGVENGTKYWLIANSWSKEWGDNGYFKFLRGVNHCGIEDSIVAGEPELEN